MLNIISINKTYFYILLITLLILSVNFVLDIDALPLPSFAKSKFFLYYSVNIFKYYPFKKNLLIKSFMSHAGHFIFQIFHLFLKILFKKFFYMELCEKTLFC